MDSAEQDTQGQTPEEDPWKVRAVAAPQLPEPALTESTRTQTFSGEQINYVMTNPVDVSFDKVREAAHKVAVLTETYDLGVSHAEEMQKGDPSFYFDLTDSVVGVRKDNDGKPNEPDMRIDLMQKTAYATNPYIYYFEFVGLPQTPDTQEQLYAFLEELFGRELAEFLIYAEDPDGLDKGGYDSDAALHELYEEAPAGPAKFLYGRRVLVDYKGVSHIELLFGLDTGELDYDANYGGDYVADFSHLKYQLSDVFPALTNLDLDDLEGMCSDFFDLSGDKETDWSRPSHSYYRTVELEDGRLYNEAHAMIDTYSGTVDNFKRSGSFEWSYDVWARGDEVEDVQFYLSSRLGFVASKLPESASDEEKAAERAELYARLA